MAKIELTTEDLELLSECVNEQKDIPADLLIKLSPGFFEKLAADGRFDFKALDKFKIPTIEYAGKRPESVILAQAAITGGAAPLQVVRSFANGKNGDWKNLIVQGDNLQFLKTCYLNHDPLIKDKVKGKVKLIYIDPPFATEGDFESKDGATSYSDKIDSAEFLENLRERLIYMKELLSMEGSIYVHLDWKKGHYVKVMMDEIFGDENFRNEIIWCYTAPSHPVSNFPRKHDVILFYSRSLGVKPNLNDVRVPYSAESLSRANRNVIKKGGTIFDGVQLNEDGKVPEDWWADINPASRYPGELLNYPTQKSERLLERIIKASSNDGDLVLDLFAGSGTTIAVTEKLNRRWIACDFGKHAIYTMQKRLLNITDSRKLGSKEKKESYGKSPKPFCVVSAGAYDFTRIMDLRKNQGVYVTFVLGLFNIVQEKNDFSKKYKLPNIYAEKNGNPVEVFPVWDDEYLKNIRIDEEYLQGIIDASGGKLKGDYFIITPETCARLGDTTLKNASKEKVNFKLLKFPYKVLEELSRHFQIEEQAASSADINRLISSVGFYFNEEVKAEAERKNGGIKITKFNSGILDKNGQRFKGLEGLAMILVDVDYDGKVFDMDVAIYSKDIGEDGVVKVEGLTKDSHIIAIDKHGNESKVIKIK